MQLQKRIEKLIAGVSAGMYEREEIIAVALLGALSGQNTFLYGPPGTAKSLISRRIACAFSQPAYFEYLMNRFSTPEEVFGPISIKELKEDRYIRKTARYLPTAEFAFLDEIWKASPAILNTLLTLINERIFRNGETLENAPLKALIAASNETPDTNQGLEALFDRFIIRLLVNPISQSQHFDALLNSKPTEATIDIDTSIVVKSDEWVSWREKIHAVRLSKETLTVIHLIRQKLDERSDTLTVFVSDRRWQRAAMLMKAAAFFNDRKETNHSDAMLLQHCLWTHEDNYQEVSDIVAQAVKDTGFDSGVNLADIDLKKNALDNEINKELFTSEDVYESVTLNKKEYFKLHAKFSLAHYSSYSNIQEFSQVFISVANIKSTKGFSPIDGNGNAIPSLTYKFNGQGTCKLTFTDRYNHVAEITYQPTVLFHKGDKKPDINKRLVSSLMQSVIDIRQELQSTLKTIEKRAQHYANSLKSPFVPEEKRQLAIAGIIEQIEQLKLRIKDCERLEALCK